ncbi:MAG: type II/IV secretion system protein, partial [Cyanobacteria bacterium J06555_13]
IDLSRYLRETDFMSFRQAAIEKVFAGITSIDEVFRVLPRSALRVTSPQPQRLPKLVAQLPR